METQIEVKQGEGKGPTRNVQSQMDFSRFRTSIISGHSPTTDQALKDYNLAVQYYSDVWLRMMRQAFGEFTPSANIENFLKFNYVINTIDRETGKIAAQAACRIFDLRAAITHEMPSLKHFRGKVFKFLEERNISRFMIIEANSVHITYSRRRSGIPFVEVSVQLAMELARTLDIKACTGVARRAAGVQSVTTSTENAGFRILQKNLREHKLVGDLVVLLMSEAKVHEEARIRDFVDQLWTNRLDVRQTEMPTALLTQN